ncbi:MAG: hypothetical protein V2A34_06750 [Lentisphaerota bacterium]
MADIKVKCAGCGTEFDVSEFASAETLMCPNCTRHVDKPEVDHGIKLKVKKHRHGERATLAGEPNLSDVIKDAAVGPSDTPASTIYDVHKIRSQVKKGTGLWGLLVFVVLGGLLVGAQYYLKDYPQYLTHYLWTRTSILALVWLLVLVMAFEDSYLQGFLCLLLPFYIVYYSFARLELQLLRGAFAAVVLMLGMELYYVKNDSMLVTAQINVNKYILNVGNLIQRASEPPDMPTSTRKKRRH